jgi:hypothetical protein
MAKMKKAPVWGGDAADCGTAAVGRRHSRGIARRGGRLSHGRVAVGGWLTGCITRSPMGPIRATHFGPLIANFVSKHVNSGEFFSPRLFAYSRGCDNYIFAMCCRMDLTFLPPAFHMFSLYLKKNVILGQIIKEIK